MTAEWKRLEANEENSRAYKDELKADEDAIKTEAERYKAAMQMFTDQLRIAPLSVTGSVSKAQKTK